jgi:hypothetical protein
MRGETKENRQREEIAKTDRGEIEGDTRERQRKRQREETEEEMEGKRQKGRDRWER